MAGIFDVQKFLEGKNSANGLGITSDLIEKAYNINPDQTNNVIRQTPIISSDVREKLGLDKIFALEGETVDTPFEKLPTPQNPPSINPLPIPQVEPQQTTAQPPAKLPVIPQVEQLTTNQLVDNATLDAMRNQPNSFDLARMASGGINDANNQLIQQIIGAKNLYETAKDGADGDAQRKSAADYANYVRQLAQMRNIDLGQFGDGNNLSAAQANLAWGNYVLGEAEKAQNKFQAVQDNLKNNFGESSNDHFWRLYDEYRQKGYSDRKATILAGRETMGYQQELVENLSNAISEYGIDDGDTLNQLGVRWLGQLAEEDKTMGSSYASAFDTPKSNAALRRQAQQKALQNYYSQSNMNLSAFLNDQNAQKAWVRGQIGADYNVDREIETHRGLKDIDLEYQKQLTDYTKSVQDRSISEQIEMREKFAEKYNLPEDVKIGYILTGNLASKKTSSGKSSNSSDDVYNKDYIDGLKKTLDSLNSSIAAEQKHLQELQPDTEEYNQVKNRLAQMINQRTRTYRAMDLMNRTAIQRGDYIKGVLNGRKITANWNDDLPIVADFNDFFYSLGMSDPEYSSLTDPTNRKKAVKKVLMQYGGYSEENANRAVGITSEPAKTPTNENKPEEQKTEPKQKAPPEVKIFNPYTGQFIAKSANPQKVELPGTEQGARFNPQTGKWEKIPLKK